MSLIPGESANRKPRRRFIGLLALEARLALREPYGVLMGLGIPLVLLFVFGFISRAVPGPVGNSGQTIIDLWTPILLVLSLLFISASVPQTLVRDREIGWLRRVSTTPVHPWRLLAAQLTLNLVLAVLAVVILIPGSALLFGAVLHAQVLFFAVSLVLAIAEIFAVGLVIVALTPSQTVAQAVAGLVTFALMFLSGLWVNPAQVDEPLRTIMNFSPSGAAARALLDSVFNSNPSYAAWVAMIVYAVLFGYLAVRYFRWE